MSYTQAQIDAVMAQVNSGQITPEELVVLYPEAGLDAGQIQANIDARNAQEPLYNPDTLGIFGYQDTPADGNWDGLYSTDDQPGSIYSGGYGEADDALGEFDQYQPIDPGQIDDSEGQNEVTDTKYAVLADAVYQIENSGATAAEMTKAIADLLKQTGMSSDAVAQVSDLDLDDINAQLEAEGYDTTGNPLDSGGDPSGDGFIGPPEDEEPYIVETDDEVNGGFTIDDWIYQGGGIFQGSDGSTASTDDYGAEVDPSWEVGGTYGVDETGNVIPSDEPWETPFPDNDPIDVTVTPNTGDGGAYGGNGPEPDNTPQNDTPNTNTDIIPDNQEEPPVSGIPDIFNPGTAAGGAASAVASAIGGAVNVSNQFDFLENSAEDQMMANRQAALDSSTLMNPNYTNPYGSQTTTPAYVDANGNLVQPEVNQTLNAPQQQLFDTETSIKQGLGDTALAGIGGVQDQFSNPYDPSGLIDRYQVNPDGIQDYSNIDLNALSSRNTMPGVTGRNAITDALIQREQPRFDRAEEQMKNDLLIRGFNPGTEGFTEQTDEFGRAQNDFNLAAQAAGAAEQSRLFGLESALRGQQLNEQDVARVGNAQNREQQVGEQMDFGRFTSDERARQLQEELSLRNLPLNELNALRQGNQATVPQFQGFSGQGVNAAPAYDAAQAQAQASGNYADGFFGLGGELLNWFGNGRTAQPAPQNTASIIANQQY